VPARSWLYTCAVPVSVQCANAHLPSIGGDLVPEKIAFILNLVRAIRKKSVRIHARALLYSCTHVNPKKVTQGHKSFSFCEQTLHKGLIDASCDWLQSTRKNRGQNSFSRKLRAKIQFPRVLFSSSRNISSYNPHTISKNARRGRLKKYIYFHLEKLQVGPRRRGLPRASICNKEHGTH
jgi:hypothetical protein